MKRYKLTSYLGIFFIGAVVIPSVILGLIALRAVNREEAYIEKQLEVTLLAEVTHVTLLVKTVLKDVEAELSRTVEVPQDDNFAEPFFQWKQQSPLVEIPFLLSSTHDILWPGSNKGTTGEEISFLDRNRDFLSNRKEIPVYQNIAVVYKDEIMDAINEPQSWSVQGRIPREKNDLLVEGANQEGFLFSSLPSQESQIPEDKRTGINSYSEIQSAKQAVSQFEQSEPVRKRVYEQAKEKGKEILSRTVRISKMNLRAGSGDKQDLKEEESIFIAEPSNFSRIIAGKKTGIIPRFIDNELSLLFWKKDENGRIVGCVINQRSFREKLLSVLPNIYSSVRILTILDENGIPLLTPQGIKIRDWRRPFVAREISEILPRWEIAVYLSDPNFISSKARGMAVIMWTLICILFVSIVSGGILVLKSLYSEITLAQQKTTFVANVSHELKTPLTSIRMFTEMLKEQRQPDENKRKKYFDIMVSETERLTRLINNVLDFSRRGQGKRKYTFRKLDIIHLCEEIIESQKVRFEHDGFQISLRRHPGSVMINADEEAIKQAVLNLLSNAEKYSGDIKKIDFEIISEQEYVFVNIKDRGIGVPAQDAINIFKEFYRVDDSLTSRVRGSGLGLTIAKQIICDHGGDILYFSREDGGSIFQIKLPIEE
ncbi:MAG: HAMP domain-containing histidine kinase [Candidatus Omnitrophica bacterium]|nr:HAMP domain-containing histidine kinase [Candidatus Omnitrophota bacterium]